MPPWRVEKDGEPGYALLVAAGPDEYFVASSGLRFNSDGPTVQRVTPYRYR